MNLLNNRKYHLPLLFALCLILFFFGIWSIPLTDGDSAFYAKIAKNMVESGDWITPHYGDAGTIINKPPLMMWITAASFKLLGVNNFSVSFWHSIFALLVVVFTYKLAELLFNSRIAIASSLVLLTSAQFFYQARSPLQDMPLTLFVLLSVYFLIKYEKTRKLPYFYLVPVFTALAVLTKGPVGLVLPAIILIAHMIINRPKLPKSFHIIYASILFLVIALPWFIVEYRLLGNGFLDTFIGSNIGRYFKPIDTIGSEATKYKPIAPQYDFFSYLLQILILSIPWSGFVYPALFKAFKKRDNDLMLIFLCAVILFFSLSLNYKISRYILPALPALSVIIGKLVIDAQKDKKTLKLFAVSSWINLLLILPALLLSVLSLYRQFSGIGSYYFPLLIPFLSIICLALAIGSVLGIMKRPMLSFAAYASVALIAYFVFVCSLAAYYTRVNPISTFCEKINKVSKSSDLVCQYKGTDAHFMIYYSKNDVVLIRDEKQIEGLMRSDKKVYCVTENEEAYRELQNYLKDKIKEMGKSANYTLFSN